MLVVELDLLVLLRKAFSELSRGTGFVNTLGESIFGASVI
jgi:hypothetical protein